MLLVGNFALKLSSAVQAIRVLMMFKRRTRANTAIPANTAMPMYLTGSETEMHISKYV